MFGGRGAGALEHLAFLQVVAGRDREPALLLPDLRGERQAAAHQRDHLAVEPGQRVAQFVEVHVAMVIP